jgi:hypothetical protein
VSRAMVGRFPSSVFAADRLAQRADRP